ncbi:MAG: diaminopimelate decarboxylase [Bacteroidetes bacterium]|nr:diaminopimelate decarboxylase [Bacteroidota bacterium]
MENLSPGKISSAFIKALEKGLVRKEDSAVIFYDLTFLTERLSYLKSCFPSGTLHGLAVKACPLASVMKLTKELGFGVEAASMGEVKLALHLGFKPEMIVYDSPAKTIEELEFALHQGIRLNLDNFSELERVKNEIAKQRKSERAEKRKIERALGQAEMNIPLNSAIRANKSSIGIRINPQIGEGSIQESSVAGEYSKFGVPLRFKKQELINAFMENDFLAGMHLHVGSQGCSLEMLAEGTGRLYDLMLEINSMTLANKGVEQITTFDIGGGLPVSYFSSKKPVEMQDYVKALIHRAPTLFSGRGNETSSKIRLVTEFGRWIYTNPGFTVSRVEYVKHDPGINTAMIHVGADLFVRECLNTRDWLHEYSLLDSRGNLRTGASANLWNLAGPLCFSGDILAKGVSLPEVQEGDHIVIHDTGGYTFSMWSRYNSRFAPRILGYFNEGESFVVLKEREGMEDIIRFWT